jgi:hypothetical protein
MVLFRWEWSMKHSSMNIFSSIYHESLIQILYCIPSFSQMLGQLLNILDILHN